MDKARDLQESDRGVRNNQRCDGSTTINWWRLSLQQHEKGIVEAKGRGVASKDAAEADGTGHDQELTMINNVRLLPTYVS